MHIAQGILKKINVDKMTSAGPFLCLNAHRSSAFSSGSLLGFTYVFWVADYFALLNHKMGGDLEKIKTVYIRSLSLYYLII